MTAHKKSQAGPFQGMAVVRRLSGYQCSDQEMLRSGCFSHPTRNGSGHHRTGTRGAGCLLSQHKYRHRFPIEKDFSDHTFPISNCLLL